MRFWGTASLAAVACVAAVAVLGGIYLGAGGTGPSQTREIYVQAVPNPDVENVTGGILSFNVFAKNPNPGPVFLTGQVTVSMVAVSGNQSVASAVLPLNASLRLLPDQAVIVAHGSFSLASIPLGEYTLVASAPSSASAAVIAESITVRIG